GRARDGLCRAGGTAGPAYPNRGEGASRVRAPRGGEAANPRLARGRVAWKPGPGGSRKGTEVEAGVGAA
ncbi:MAG TPA: hypothetical protein VFW01_07130, partial [bacterium]|nr:hypothetical protein [bacterium]